VLLLCKSCSRKKPAPTIAYVALKVGQRRTRKAQITASIEIARRVEGERGKQSAKITPIAATAAKPTNGWRGPLNNFIIPLFVHFAGPTQALLELSCAKIEEQHK